MKNTDLAQKYLNGDPDAIVLLDVAVGVALDLNYLRSNPDKFPDYLEQREGFDQEIDDLSPQILALKLESVLTQL